MGLSKSLAYNACNREAGGAVSKIGRMWRLKIAEGGNNPYIYSTNNFVGRQTWEFDPEAGTPEERTQVEEARENFWRDRFLIRPSSDLLWRFQV